MAATPDRIGRYWVREVIGTGGFATVYRASDERLGVDVAVKVLAENRSLDADIRERFIEEGRRLRRLRSPHLITAHDLGETERAQPYLVLDWADRGDLASRVAARRAEGWRPGPGDALAVARVVAAALEVLHQHRLVHRDVAPGNLLLRSVVSPRSGSLIDGDLLSSPSGASIAAEGAPPVAPAGTGHVSHPPLVSNDEELVLADLGVSKDLAAASGLTLAAGTSGFAPPEQREPGDTVDHRADIWAASALIVWLVVDRPPDGAGAWRHDLHVTAGWPGAAAEALARGLATEPADRYRTITEWFQAIEEALRLPSAGSPEPGAVSSAPLPAAPPGPLDPGAYDGEAVTRLSGDGPGSPDRRRHRTRLPALLATVAAVLAIATFFVISRGSLGGPEVSTERLEGGDLRTTVEGHGMTIRIDGPTEVPVDQVTTLSASVEGTDNWTWIGPDGALRPGQPTIDVEPATTGRGTVAVLAIGSGNERLEATHRLEVVE